jgi:hypothetical protein
MKQLSRFAEAGAAGYFPLASWRSYSDLATFLPSARLHLGAPFRLGLPS